MKRLLVFIILVLIFQIVFFSYKLNRSKQTIKSKAQTIAFFGFNIHSLPLLDGPQINQLLTMVSQCNNTNVVRFWGFSAGGESYQARLSNARDNIGKVLKNSPANMKFIITLSNYYKAGVFQPWPAAEDNPSRWFAGDWKTNGFADFVNTVTTTYKGNSKILMWEIMNEPNCTDDDICTQAQHKFLKEISDIIAKNDPGKLISAGNQAQNTGGENFANGEYEDIISYKNITAASCHTYIGDQYSTKENCLQALTIAKKYNKPFFIGELGENLGCTSPECINTCSTDKLASRKNDILTVVKEFVNLGAAGVLVWQFSPERNSTLTCDGSSVFPGDPFCSITGNKTLTGTETNTNNTVNTNTNVATMINFNPQNPTVNNSFKVVISSGTGFVWVHMKIFDKDGKKIIQEGGKGADQPKVSKTKDGFQWVYDASGLAEGDYKVIFYSGCDQGCKEQSSRTLSIGAGKTNEVQQEAKTTTQTTTQNQQEQNKNANQTTQENQTTTQTTNQNSNNLNRVSFNLPVQNKITFYIPDIDPIDPMTLEYCDKFQTDRAGCTDPHDQVVENNTVTMSYPFDKPPIFCGSVPANRRGEVRGSDRLCFAFVNPNQ